MDIFRTISRRNFLGKLLNLGAVGVLLLPLPPILVHAQRQLNRGGNQKADWQSGLRFKFSFDFPSKTAVDSVARLRMDMVNYTDERLYDVRVRLETPEGADWVGGEDSWSGNLKRDDRIGFETLIKFRSPGVYDFRYIIEGTSENGNFSRHRPISIIVVE